MSGDSVTYNKLRQIESINVTLICLVVENDDLAIRWLQTLFAVRDDGGYDAVVFVRLVVFVKRVIENIIVDFLLCRRRRRFG